MSEEQKYLIEVENGFGIAKNDGFYNFHLLKNGVVRSLWLDTDEMYDFMKLMTDKKTQATFREEMGFMRCIRDIEKRITDGLEEGKKEGEVVAYKNNR